MKTAQDLLLLSEENSGIFKLGLYIYMCCCVNHLDLVKVQWNASAVKVTSSKSAYFCYRQTKVVMPSVR